jgi:isopentenyl-diphosphate delta-isomerase
MTGKKSLQNRKDDHIRINIQEDVESGYTNGLELYALEHCALPDINLENVDTGCEFLGYKLEMPLIISSMTGGSKEGEKINRNLAEIGRASCRERV